MADSDTEDPMTAVVRMLRPLLLCLLAAGGLPGVAATQEPPLPPPGELVDLGGWRLHLHCTGEASPSRPTVVLEAGAGDFSVGWSLVQPEVARFARVCSYDRAGHGWSELGPRPRTMRQLVWELHELLARAQVKPPFVLVGASMGGWIVRVYASTYPNEVSGLVLVDAGEDDPLRIAPDGRETRSSILVAGRSIPPVQTGNPLREEEIPQRIVDLILPQALQLGARANDPPRDRLPEEAQRMRTWSISRITHHVVNDNEVEAEELAALRSWQARTPYPYGELPLIVLSAGLSDSGSPLAGEEAERRLASHAAVAALSRRGRHAMAQRSGHHIQIEQPELVVAAIREATFGP